MPGPRGRLLTLKAAGRIKWLIGEVLQPPTVPGEEPLSKLSCGMCGCMVALTAGIFVVAIVAILLSRI